MKKTQVALAALALVASTAALAEVKLSGIVDIGVGSTTKNSAGVGGTFMEQGSYNDHSAINLDASEDLGNGMKAYASLGMGFDANGYNDNGGTAGSGAAGTSSIFNRQSFVGISGDFGSLQLGKQLSPFILSNVLMTSGVGNFYVNRMALGGGGGLACGGSGFNTSCFFMTNAIQYTTPSISGWTVTAMMTTPNGTHGNVMNGAATAADTDRYTAYRLGGAIGPMNLTAAYHSRKNTYSSTNVGGTMQLMEGLSGSLGYLTNTVEGASAVGSYNAGLSYALTGATTATLQYAKGDSNGGNQSLTNLTFANALSKRTTAYATWARGTNGISGALGAFGGTIDKDNTTIVVGIVNSF